ncbi:MFS general substrate transporter [Thozetella sp. PMI_491]|nr:MFS general substrate transporter [Thozetella sp. PMI_491]
MPSRGRLDDGSRQEPSEVNFREIQHSFAFWAIIIGIGFTLWLAALENSALTTAAPAILVDIPLADDWIWLTNAFFLTSAAFQPVMGQLANLYGRRWLTMCAIATFVLGSGICGGANAGSTLIAGRGIQGIGSGGILLGIDMIISDLIPLRYRGNYIAIVLLIYSVGTTMGALIGGVIVDNISWRWVFYINLPIGGVSLLVMFMFLKVKHRRDTSWISRLKRIDVVGNSILIASTVSMLIALTYAGTRHPWSSWQTLVPLLLGFAGFFVFGAFEASHLAPAEPVMPPRLFANRTSVIIAINTFLFTAVVYWAIFFMPVYFQAVQMLSPTRAGVNVIPVSLLGVPAAAAASAAVSRWGKYKAIHLLGFFLFTVGLGLFSLLDENSPTGEWVGFMFVGPIGGGLLLNTQLPAFQAPVPETDQAAATGAWNFLRAMGSVWGVAIPAAIFANRVDGLVTEGAVSNPVAASLMSNGGAYQFASAAFVKLFPLHDQAEIRAVYRLALQRVFLVGIAFSGFAFLLCLFEKDIPLRKELTTEFGLQEDQNLWNKSGQPKPNSDKHVEQVATSNEELESGLR